MLRSDGSQHGHRSNSGELPCEGGIWRALLDGRWSVVESGPTRWLLASNSRELRRRRRLTDRERGVVFAICEGKAGKLVAYEFGLSPSAVSRHLGEARRKLGVGAVDLLVALYRLVGRGQNAASCTILAQGRRRGAATMVVSTTAAPGPELPPAMAAVARGLLGGLSLREIAETRGRSVGTVAKQSREIYQRLGLDGRRGLAAM